MPRERASMFFDFPYRRSRRSSQISKESAENFPISPKSFSDPITATINGCRIFVVMPGQTHPPGWVRPVKAKQLPAAVVRKIGAPQFAERGCAMDRLHLHLPKQGLESGSQHLPSRQSRQNA